MSEGRQFTVGGLSREAVERLTAAMKPGALPVAQPPKAKKDLVLGVRRPRWRTEWIVTRLREQGLLVAEIAERLDVGLGYVSTCLPARLSGKPVARTRAAQGQRRPRRE